MHLAPLLLLTAVGVSAHPSGHAHLHRSVHDKRGKTITTTIDGKVVSWEEGVTSPFVKTLHSTPPPAPAAPAPAPAEHAAAVPAAGNAAASAGGSSQSSSVYKAFNCPAPVRKRASQADLAYQGNTGCGHDGSNYMLIDESLVDKYPFSILVKAPGVETECAIWNNFGKNGGMAGSFKGQEAMTFTLPAHGQQRIAVDSNSLGALTCYGGSIPVSQWGQYLGYWSEFNINNQRNGAWNGWDCSAIPAGAAGTYTQTPYGCKVSRDDGSQVSQLHAFGAGGSAAFFPGDAEKDGIGGKLDHTDSLRLIADYSGQ